MRNKVLVPAMPSWRGNSPGNRKALAVKMNNFVDDDTKLTKVDSSIGTWPLKGDKRKQTRKPRPLTATLDRPRLLDISLLGKIDMSLMRKELLSIYTLMRAPITVKQQTKQTKRPKAISDDTDNDENSSPVLAKPKCKAKRSSKHDTIQSIMIDTCSQQGHKKDSQRSSTKSLTLREKSPLKLGPAISRYSRNRVRKKVDEIFSGPVVKPLAIPCDSCGRTSHPERLHTHPPPPSPVTPISTRNISLKPNNNIPPRSRSDELLNVLRDKEKSEERQGSVHKRRTPPRRNVVMDNTPPPPRSARHSRNEPEQAVVGVPVLCSYCGRRFGTASIAIHEGKCRERKEQANNVSGESRPRVPRASTSPTRRQSSPRKLKPRAETAEGLVAQQKPPQITLTVPTVSSPRTSESSREAQQSVQSPRPRHSAVTVNNHNRLKPPVPEEIPEAEDYVFKSDGSLDCEATFHQIWANHLKSLIQCPLCERRFAPERIERHRAVCNGVSKRPANHK